MTPTMQLGPMAIQVPGLIILVGIWLGLTLAERNAARFGVNASDLSNLALIALLSGIIGARLVYVLRYTSAFKGNLISVFSINPELLDPAGGVCAGLLAAFIFGQRKKMPFWSTLDALTPALAVFMLALGLSHVASGAAFGALTNLPWSVNLWGAHRHPSQAYESLAAVLILAILWPGRTRIFSTQPGIYFLSFVVLSAGARLFLEAFRGDSPLILSGLRSAQVAAWVILALSLMGIYWIRKSV